MTMFPAISFLPCERGEGMVNNHHPPPSSLCPSPFITHIHWTDQQNGHSIDWRDQHRDYLNKLICLCLSNIIYIFVAVGWYLRWRGGGRRGAGVFLSLVAGRFGRILQRKCRGFDLLAGTLHITLDCGYFLSFLPLFSFFISIFFFFFFFFFLLLFLLPCT